MESGPKEEIMVDGKPVLATVTGITDIDEANAANANVRAVEQAAARSLPAAVLCAQSYTLHELGHKPFLSACAHNAMHVQQPPTHLSAWLHLWSMGQHMMLAAVAGTGARCGHVCPAMSCS